MSEIKVNKISPRSGTEVTLGDSGDTFTIPSGATINNQGTATNFGATGSASWTTTVKTNSDSGFTAVAGEGYFLDTSSGTISVNLPAGTAGAVVAFKDYANTFDTNAVTLVQNGSDKIGGSSLNGVLETEGQAVTLIFIDSTKGWLVTDDGIQNSVGSGLIQATGGTVTESGNCRIHTFTGPGSFVVSQAAISATNNIVSYLVVAGGGGTGRSYGGGGGAGGFRELKNPVTPYTASPLDGYSTPGNRITVSAQSYPIQIGGGGAVATPSGPGNPATDGSNSSFSTITSAGGGGGGHYSNSGPGQAPGRSGGSGGGGADGSVTGGTGNTPPVTPSQGNNGGNGYAPGRAGGGGGAGSAGQAGTGSGAGVGGAGVTTSISTTPTAYAGGGGSYGNEGGTNGGTGGGGAGGNPGVAGTANTGGGGGGSGTTPNPEMTGTGGSGIVIIRYKFK
jgi:hypothetical protein